MDQANWGTRLYFSDDRQSPLKAHRVLSKIRPEHLYNDAKSGRTPPSSYLNSVSRICERARSLCEAAEARFVATVADPEHGMPNSSSKYIEAIELAVYAAAEHIDDVNRIAAGLFSNKASLEKSPAFTKYNSAMRDCRKPISIMANRIKHEALRVRPIALEYGFDGRQMWLHGFRLEIVKDAMALPDKVAHGKGETISVVTLVWEIVILLLRCSDALHDFIKETLHLDDAAPEPCAPFSTLIRSLLRLPQYDFVKEGPIKRYKVFVDDTGDLAQVASGLRGSFKEGWGTYLRARPLGTVLETVAETGMTIKLATEMYVECVDWWG
uniref:hypothetical protein n=1 Tax=Variovorax sp. BK018 TaxID=3450241 RepID=UPI00403965BA